MAALTFASAFVCAANSDDRVTEVVPVMVAGSEVTAPVVRSGIISAAVPNVNGTGVVVGGTPTTNDVAGKETAGCCCWAINA